ncbi:SMP-30/gluconolactonase/LRE family protein [Labrys sp. La1]|uniref:SMP-30/gluconolactonase/LRE family protein n=1 Tax=Labrys sp. La1 TaxID=3404917 RepID=UPI003EBCA49D
MSALLHRALLALMISLSWTSARASQWRILAQFDDAPEGLVADADGNLFVSLFHSGRIMRVTGDGRVSKVADLRDVIGDAKGSTVGIDWDRKDHLYVAFSQYSERYPWPAKAELAAEACGDATVTKSGLYRVTITTGKVEAIVTRADGYPFCFPDDPVYAPDGTIFLSDLSLQAIWKIDPEQKAARIWSKDRLFSPGDRSLSGYPVGVNGIALARDGKALFGVTGGIPMLVRVPILDDGRAGKAQMLAFGYDNMDGLEVDRSGNFYLTETTRSEIWKVSADASKRQQLGNPLEAPLGAPASIALVNDELCVTNLNFFKNLPPAKANSIVCRKLDTSLW